MQQKGTFDTRAFVALTIAISGMGLPMTGLPLHMLDVGPPSLARHAWMSAHNSLAFFFLVFSVWHVWLNRRTLWSHLRRRAAQASDARREALLALAVVGLSLLIVSHAFLVG